MSHSPSLKDLLGRVVLAPHEAVAIVQQLVNAESTANDHDAADETPALDAIHLTPGGEVQSQFGCVSASSAGRLLDSLLPSGTGVVPGALRYTIARALGAVDAPRFASVEALQQSLSRFERGDRREVVRALLARNPAGTIALASSERRRSAISIAALRRDLREADRLLYEQQVPPVSVSVRVAPQPAPWFGFRWPTALAIILASALIGYVVVAVWAGNASRVDGRSRQLESQRPRLLTSRPSG